jgi:O-antigen/teichoic acid export membrane protein
LRVRAPVDVTPSERPLKAEKRLIRRGVAWNAVGMIISKSASILAKLALARFLLPEHFGFISMIVVFSSVAKIFADLGFRLSLIQRPRDRRTKLLYDSAFWLLLATALVVFVMMWLAGIPLLVWFYGEPRLATVALAMSTVVLFQNMQVVPETRLARAMRFKQIAIAEMTGTLSGCGVALGLALWGAGVWSLVAQTLVAAAITSGAMFVLSAWRPRLRFDWAMLGQLSSFSRYIVGSRILISLQHNLDYLLIGKLMGAKALGIYAIAFLLTETLRSHAYWLVSKAVFPFYSRATGRDSDIRSVYLGTVRYMAVTVFPLATILILFADPLVTLLFTPSWHSAVVPIQILATASIVVASAGTPGEVLRGIGRPDLDFRINLCVALLVALPALWIGIEMYGLPGAALAVLAYSAVSTLAYGIALHRMVGVRIGNLVRAMGHAVAGCAIMVAVTRPFSVSHWPLALALAVAAYGIVILPLVLPMLNAVRTAADKTTTASLRESAMLS